MFLKPKRMIYKLTKYLFASTLILMASCGEAPKDEQSEDTPSNETSGEEVAETSEELEECFPKSDFVPEGWKIIAEEKGDLNKDGKPDLVLVIQNTDSKNVIKDEFSEIDSNPRTLLILFAGDEKNCYTLNTESKTFIIAHTLSNMEDPFEGIEISKGTLRTKFIQFATIGTWFTSNHTYVWRFQDDEFKLIGASSTEFHRGSGEASDVSVNFSTGKYSLKSYNMFDEEVEETEEWKTLKNKTLKTFASFKEPWSWNINDDIRI